MPPSLFLFLPLMPVFILYKANRERRSDSKPISTREILTSTLETCFSIKAGVRLTTIEIIKATGNRTLQPQ
jgi:hypothetical protein